MVYNALIDKKEVLLEEFGVEKFAKRVVVCPIEWDRVFPDDWVSRMRKKYAVKEILPGDNHLRKLEKNYLINDTLFIFVNRGVAEATDRFYILARNPAVNEIIFVGTCASLVDRLDTGDINIPEFVLPWEDISSEFVDASSAIPKGNGELIKKATNLSRKAAKKHGVKVGNDNNATVELFYGETLELLDFFKHMNVSTIDMELSALYRLANGFGKKAVGILRVADRPLHKEEYFSKKHIDKDQARNDGRETMFQTVEMLINRTNSK